MAEYTLGPSIDKHGDSNIVDWEGPDDPEMPLNWSTKKKYTNTTILSVIALGVNLATTMYAPAAPLLMKDLNVTSSTVGTMTVSIYVLGFAVAPLVLSPLSEIYGRLIIYQIANGFFLLATLACALSTKVGMFLAFRFIAGTAASAPMTVVGGTAADLFPQEERGRVMGMLALGPILGPVIGPIAGGFIGQEIGWRWTFWVILIYVSLQQGISGIVNVLALVFMRETYAPVILERKAARLRKTSNNPHLRSRLDKGIPPSQILKRSIVLPLKLLLFSPIVGLISLYVAFAYGLTFLLFATFPAVFEEQYHFGPGVSGLAYLGMGLGYLIGIGIFTRFSDKLLEAQAAKDALLRDAEPEYRLFLMLLLTPVLPIGFFWYGWSADQATHWIVPILGTGVIGIGSLFIFMPAQTYLVDIHGAEAAASALAANLLLRSLCGAFLPMAGPKMYSTLGLGWGNSLLGFIGFAFMPVPFLFWKYGETIRKRWPVVA
ncbi:polyamine transporter 4 [Lophiostoma macrostomum CBS 122681]|uniref:Polyamine transporter 4 n=1 Tax=Lophiostoma macrostomum CBS 122681 TaxID=1314788 RepID=A0A6A6TQA8_9PLEO|nr:polyamine transporter 4 [Lophiostoma macrostomum CBS 122681]